MTNFEKMKEVSAVVDRWRAGVLTQGQSIAQVTAALAGMPEQLTCHDCPGRGKCQYVDDPYNTGGACLAIK